MSETMTAAEAAALLGYTRAWVVRLVQAGRLKGERIGPERRGVWQIDRASVEEYLTVRSSVRSDSAETARNVPEAPGSAEK